MKNESNIFFKTGDERSDLVVENAVLLFRNFEGRKTKYNDEGNRNFAIALTDEQVELLQSRGWSPACKKIEATGEILCHLKVAAKFENFPPVVKLHTRKSTSILDHETVGMIDGAVVTMADLVIHPYFWDVNESSGVKAYLKEAHITLEEDYFADKYEKEDDEELPWDEE